MFFNNEKVGDILNLSDDTQYRIKNPEEFNTIDEYYNYLKTINSNSDEIYQDLKLIFNNNFKKYNKNRYIEFDINKFKNNIYIKKLEVKKEEPNEKLKKFISPFTEITGGLYLNNNKIYTLPYSVFTEVIMTKVQEPIKKDLKNINSFISNNASSPRQIEGSSSYFRSFGIYEPDNINQFDFTSYEVYGFNARGIIAIKAGTKFKVTLNSKNISFIDDEKGEDVFLYYTEKEPNIEKIEEIYKGEQIVKSRIEKIGESKEKKIKAKRKKISDKIYEIEVLEDVFIESDILKYNSFYFSKKAAKLEDDFLKNIDIEKYKKAIKENNFKDLFGTVIYEIKEPNQENYRTLMSSSMFIDISTSLTFGESSTGTIKIKYVDENNKEILDLETIIENKPWYTRIEIPKKEIKGYEFISSSQPLIDLVMSGERTITFNYQSIKKTREIPYNIIYKADETKDFGKKEVKTKGVNGIEKYKEINPDDSQIIKQKIDEVITIGTKPSVEIENLPSQVRYEKDDTREKGLDNIVIKGKDGSKTTTTTYTVNSDNGEVTSHIEEPVIVSSKNTIVKVAAKDKTIKKKTELPIIEKQTNTLVRGKERITQGRSRIEKEITEYTVNETTGDITENKRVEVVDEGTPTVKEVGTRNPINKIVNEQEKELTSEELVDYTEPNYDSPDGTTAEGDPIYNVRRITTTYKADDTLEKGKQVVEKNGKSDGNKVIKVGTKPIVEVETISSSTRYKKDDTREKGQENITVQGKDGNKTRTTTYTVDENTGDTTPHPQDPVIIEPITTIIKVALKDKVVYSKDGDNIVKDTTTYTINETTGDITENTIRETFKENSAKDKVVVETLPSPVIYEKDESREKGQDNIIVQGKDGDKTTTTTYTVNPKTGEVKEHPQEPVIVEPTTTTIKVALKDKVETVNKDDGSVVKETTSYTINKKTGEITETKTEEVIKNKVETSKGEDTPPTLENTPEFTDGVNSTEAPIVEDLPELKVVIIKDKENNILDVIKENEIPKDIKGYKNTGKTEIDKDGYKVYIYEKVENKEETSIPKTEEKTINKNKEEVNKENKKEIINKKEELPKTSTSIFSTVGLLSILGVRRKKDK